MSTGIPDDENYPLDKAGEEEVNTQGKEDVEDDEEDEGDDKEYDEEENKNRR